MKHTGARIILLAAAMFAQTTLMAQKPNINAVIKNIETQTLLLLKEIDSFKTDKNIFPRSLENGQVRLVKSSDWTSGFFAGNLWRVYELAKDEKWKLQAAKFTGLLHEEQYNAKSHDVGFKVYCSYGNGYNITNNEEYKNVIVQAAKTLSKRFSTKTGLIRSWDFGKEWQYPVIIDNMMNLELLFEATKLSGDSSFYKIAVSHANNTLLNHFRSDYSSYHVVNYDSTTGKVINKQTYQGYANESSWARGQGWALYGFTMCYRETKDPKYLKQADSIAAYILHNKNLPNDMVPYWDYDAPGKPNVPRDASAAAVVASALYELSSFTKQRKSYIAAADKITNNLSKYYLAKAGTEKGFLILHSTGHKPINGEVDTPIIYGDYYYLEALLRSNKIVR